MITRMTTIEVAPERAAEWEDMWHRVHAVYRQHPGFRGARLLRNADRPGYYVLQTEWEERAHANEALRIAGMTWIARGLGCGTNMPRLSTSNP